MSSSGDDTEWYEEPITIVGFAAGFLLLVLVIASVLILCHSKEDDDDDDEEKREHNRNDVVNGGPRGTHAVEHDKTNPLYISANEFDLRPFPPTLRAKFVHIHVDEPRVTREGFESYYNTARTDHSIA